MTQLEKCYDMFNVNSMAEFPCPLTWYPLLTYSVGKTHKYTVRKFSILLHSELPFCSVELYCMPGTHVFNTSYFSWMSVLRFLLHPLLRMLFCVVCKHEVYTLRCSMYVQINNSHAGRYFVAFRSTSEAIWGQSVLKYLILGYSLVFLK